MSKVELAWAAGFYDGEGSISCTANNGNPNTRIQLSIGQKNDDGKKSSARLERFKRAMGVGKIYKKTRIGKEINQSQFLVCKAADVGTCVKLLWPNISVEKRNQMARAVEKFQHTTKKKII